MEMVNDFVRAMYRRLVDKGMNSYIYELYSGMLNAHRGGPYTIGERSLDIFQMNIDCMLELFQEFGYRHKPYEAALDYPGILKYRKVK